MRRVRRCGSLPMPSQFLIPYRPTSNPKDGPNAMSYWVVDRHVDNNANPKENDGRIYEVLRP